IADYTLNDGTTRTIVGVDGDCTGHIGVNDIAVSVNDSLGLITFAACSNYSSSVSGATIIIQLGTSAGGTNFITNPSSSNTYPITLNGTQGDTGSILIPIITDDQIMINSIVDESVTFSINDTSIGFGVLTDASSRYATADTLGTNMEAAAHSITVGSNATGGYTLTIQGTTLESGPDSITPIGGIAAASNPGTEQFGIRLTALGGSGIVSSPYNSPNYAFDVANFPDTIASASGATANTVYSVYYLANISSTTEAGIYTTSLTYVVTGSF
ncbi:hypothetical protein KC573_03625, partial [candidate division WWE3 bacterium]|nr:hypothetical protein [candidate division WWE3 bacterium]